MLDEIRTGCAQVAAVASLVTIDPDRVTTYATAFLPEELHDPLDQPLAGGPSVDADLERRAALVVALDAVNFGSGYHPEVRKRPGCSGAVTMSTALRAWATDAPVTAKRLTDLGVAETHMLFDQPEDNEACVELMELFTAALNDLGQIVADDYDGSFVALIESADGSADRLVAVLDRLPFYRDVAPYRGRQVPFYKRAQLTAADLAREFSGTGPGHFDDLDRLTAFADNLVPHVLRVDGVLHYDDELAAAVDAGEPLDAGSEAEVEIRAVGVHAVELLRASLADAGHDVRSSRLDELLWLRGGGARYKAVPRHRTRSVFY